MNKEDDLSGQTSLFIEQGANNRKPALNISLPKVISQINSIKSESSTRYFV